MNNYNDFAYYEENETLEIGFSNKNFVFDEFFQNKRYAILKQIHSDIVINVSEPLKFKEGDGLITDKKGLYLIIKTADCYPVIAYNLKAGFAAALHSGWRGVYKNIFKEFKNKAVEMTGDNEAIEKETFFIIGPGICKECYEVGKEFYERFKLSGFGKELFEFKGNSIFFDIRGGIKKRLADLNFTKENIRDIPFCTYENDFLFSYRKNKTGLRLYNFIMLK